MLQRRVYGLAAAPRRVQTPMRTRWLETHRETVQLLSVLAASSLLCTQSEEPQALAITRSHGQVQESHGKPRLKRQCSV